MKIRRSAVFLLIKFFGITYTYPFTKISLDVDPATSQTTPIVSMKMILEFDKKAGLLGIPVGCFLLVAMFRIQYQDPNQI